MRPVKLIISILVTQYKEIATSVYISVVVLLVKHQTAVCVKTNRQKQNMGTETLAFRCVAIRSEA